VLNIEKNDKRIYVSDELHHQIKIDSAIKDVSMQEYVDNVFKVYDKCKRFNDDELDEIFDIYDKLNKLKSVDRHSVVNILNK
jgi:hypothetical protein